MMTRNDIHEESTLTKVTVAGSLISAVVLFALSMVAVIVVGFILGAMVLIERLARQCNSEDCEEVPARIETRSGAAMAR